MKTINVRLTGNQILYIADALNTEAQRFDKMRENRQSKAPSQTIKMWREGAVERYAIAQQLVAACKKRQPYPASLKNI